MKDKISKVIFALLIIALILFSCVGIFALFNGLVAYKNASGNDLISFVGGIIGSVIAGIIAIVTFHCTIKNNNKNQKEAHDLQIKLNIENNNLQTSLKVQDNLNRKMEAERAVLATTYNHLENFLFSVSNMENKNDDYIEMKNGYLRLYNEVISSVNHIKFNSEIFDDRTPCENCSMCEIKTYGTLVKSAADIQKEMIVIDEKCHEVLRHLEIALNTAAQSKQLIDEGSRLQKINLNNEQLIALRKSQIMNPVSLPPSEEVNYNNEIAFMLNKISVNNQRIAEIDDLLKINAKTVGEQSALAREKAAQIDGKNKLQLYILIRKYFANYNLYIKEMVFSVEKNGKKPNSGCAKLDFERNHTKNE